MADALVAAFQALRQEKRKPQIGSYAARPLRSRSPHLAALTSDELPCVLLRAVDSRREPIPPLRLQGLEIQYDVRCQVSVANAPASEEVFTTVVCTTSNLKEQEYFIHAAGMVLHTIGRAPTVERIAIATRHLANIFQKLARPARQTITGIIGELLFIRISESPLASVKSWRVADHDRFDFVLGSLRVDVKATERRERAHHLTYEQCNPPEGAAGLLASFQIEATGGGMLLAELIDDLEAEIAESPEAVIKLHETISETLGQSLLQALSVSFDYELAVSSLKLFDLRAIPGIRGLLPASVSEVRFKAHLGDTQEVDIGALGLSLSEHQILPAPGYR